MIRQIHRGLRSLSTANYLFFILTVLLVYGAIVMPLDPSFKEINSVPLFEWLTTAPVRASWWLWVAVITIAMLVINTIVCTIESAIRKQKGKRLLLTLAPQVIHVGFCFFMFAHFVSAYGSSHKYGALFEGDTLRLDGGIEMYLEKINYEVEYSYVTDVNAEIMYRLPDGRTRKDVISPNNPSFYKGTAIYLKDISFNPSPVVLIELSVDPGVPWALTGAVLFLAGTIGLVFLKIQGESEQSIR